MLQLFHFPFKNWMQRDFHFHEIALQRHETKGFKRNWKTAVYLYMVWPYYNLGHKVFIIIF